MIYHLKTVAGSRRPYQVYYIEDDKEKVILRTDDVQAASDRMNELNAEIVLDVLRSE